MFVIVSNVLEDKYSKFTVVKSFEELQNMDVTVDVLIIHRYEGLDFTAGGHITKLRNSGVKHFFYITSDPSPIVQMVLEGVAGYYTSDEGYFEDEEELYNLVTTYSNETGVATSLVTTSIDAVDNFVEMVKSKDKRVYMPITIQKAESAVTTLKNINRANELRLHSMGKASLDVFDKASNLIRNISANRDEMEKQLNKLREMANNTGGRSPLGGAGVFSFPTYRHMESAKVLLVREYSPCRYLTSLMLAYLNYLDVQLNKRVKLIFVHQKGAGVAARYSGFTAITSESKGYEDLYASQIIATNDPKKDTLRKLLTMGDEIVIVADRLYGLQDIVAGRVTKVNACNSWSDITRFKLNAADTIFSVVPQEKQLFCIQTITKYPLDVGARHAVYGRAFSNCFDILNSRLGLGSGR